MLVAAFKRSRIQNHCGLLFRTFFSSENCTSYSKSRACPFSPVSSYRTAHGVLARARRFLPSSSRITVDFMLVTEAAGCSTADAAANGAVFAEVQAAAALALNRSATAAATRTPPPPQSLTRVASAAPCAP